MQNLRLVRATSEGELRCSIDIMPGSLLFNDDRNQPVVATSVPLNTSRWVRVEWRVDHAMGRVVIKLFNRPNATSATQVVRATPGPAIGFSADGSEFGRTGNQPFAVSSGRTALASPPRGTWGPQATDPARSSARRARRLGCLPWSLVDAHIVDVRGPRSRVRVSQLDPADVRCARVRDPAGHDPCAVPIEIPDPRGTHRGAYLECVPTRSQRHPGRPGRTGHIGADGKDTRIVHQSNTRRTK